MNFEKKEILPLTKKQERKYKKNKKSVTYTNKNSITCPIKMIIIVESEIIVIVQGNSKMMSIVPVIQETIYSRKFL